MEKKDKVMFAIFDREKNDFHKDIHTNEITLFATLDDAQLEFEKLNELCDICDHEEYVENKVIVTINFDNDEITIGEEII